MAGVVWHTRRGADAWRAKRGTGGRGGLGEGDERQRLGRGAEDEGCLVLSYSRKSVSIVTSSIIGIRWTGFVVGGDQVVCD